MKVADGIMPVFEPSLVVGGNVLAGLGGPTLSQSVIEWTSQGGERVREDSVRQA